MIYINGEAQDGDMQKSTYDTNDDQIINQKAERPAESQARILSLK